MQIEFVPTESDVAEVKAILNQSGTQNDEYIRTMLPLLLEDVMVYTNNDFGGIQEGGKLRIPGGVKIYLAKALEHNLLKAGLKSRSMGSVSYSYDLEFPESLKKYLKPYRKVKFHASR